MPFQRTGLLIPLGDTSDAVRDRDTEIDFLLDLLDYTNDGKIEKNDFEAFRESGLLLLLAVNIYSHGK